MAAKHEVEAKFTLKDEMSVQLETIRKRAAALEKDAKALSGQTKATQATFSEFSTALERFSPGLGRAISSVQGLTAGLSPLAIGVGAVAGAVTVAGGVVASWTREIVELGGSLTDLASKAGVSTDFVQEFGFAGKQVGVDIQTVTDGVTVLSRRLGADLPEARKAVEGLGLSMSNLAAQRPEESFQEILVALRGIQNPAQQAAAAMAIFGRQGLSFLPLIRSDFEGVIEELHAVGGVMEGETLAAADKLGDQMEVLTAAFQGVKAQVAGEVIPILSELAAQIIEVTKFTVEWKDESDALREQFSSVTDSIGTAVPFLKNWGDELENATEKAKALKLVFDTFGLGALRDPFGEFPEPPPAPGAPARPAGVVPIGDTERKQIEKESERIIKSQIQAQKEVAAAAAQATREFNAQVDAVRTLDDAIQQLSFDTESGFGLADEEILAEAESWAHTAFEIEGVSAALEKVFEIQAKVGSEMGFHLETAEEIRQIVEDYPEGVGDVEAQTRELEQTQQDYNEALSVAADISRLIGGNIGDIIGQTLGAVSALENLTKAGGIGGLFSAGKGDATGILGFLGGVGGLVSGLGPLIAPAIAGIKELFSFGGPDIGRDVGRDIGANISEELESAIEDSGENAQLFLREIFAEGDLGIDRFAEEVGDLFSFFERGEISETGLIGELRETLPILIEHFDELGPAGEEQLERIIQAAEDAGIEIEELGEIIALTLDDDEILAIVGQLGVTQAAADALGISFDQLQGQLEGIFAPETLEGLAENFGKTTEEMRAIAADLGINVQTELERAAASIGLTVSDFEALGEAFEASTGIGSEELVSFLEQSGLSAEELAQALGVDVTASIGTVNEEAAGAATEIGAGADEASRLADELQRAAAAASGIRIPDFSAPAFNVQSPPDVSAQGGFFSKGLGADTTIQAHKGEEVRIGQPGEIGDENTFTVNVGVDVLLPALERISSSIEELPDAFDTGIDLSELAAQLTLPPELLETTRPDPAVEGAATGETIANALAPKFSQMSSDISGMRLTIDRLPDTIARAVRDAVAAATG